jgi:hypothetical protein
MLSHMKPWTIIYEWASNLCICEAWINLSICCTGSIVLKKILRWNELSDLFFIFQRTVVNRPLAGTIRRGKTKAEDKVLEQLLLSDQKQCAEHIMLVDLGRNDVGKVHFFALFYFWFVNLLFHAFQNVPIYEVLCVILFLQEFPIF